MTNTFLVNNCTIAFHLMNWQGTDLSDNDAFSQGCAYDTKQ